MRVPLGWLKDFVDVSMSPESLADTLTMAGLEVSKIDRVGEDWARNRVLVGEVVEVIPHPHADRLTIAKIIYGSGKVTETITGAPNIRAGDRGVKVVLALPGASFVDPESDGTRQVVLKPAEIRGVHSEGMLCSERELGISEDHRGVMMLDLDAPVGKPLQDYLGDTVLELDLTPNLGRCLSMIGVAREVAALTGQKMKTLPKEAFALAKGEDWNALTDHDPTRATTPFVTVEIDQPELCSRYSASLIEGVTIQPSPQWMQNRLRLAGMRPVNNVVDITNYCMWEWGQPLHAFDYEKIAGKAIHVRRARRGEEITTLDGVVRKLVEENLLIVDGDGPVAVAGVMGGLDSEVAEETKAILLESANFDLVSVRRTVQALKLPSEASLRFGKGIDPELTVPSLKRASILMGKLSGGSVCPEIADAYPVKAQERLIYLSTGEVKRILGMDFAVGQITDILEPLDFRCHEELERPGTLAVTVPTHRLDISIPADLIEEVSRIHGYDKIPSTLMADVLPPQRRNEVLDFEDFIRDTLTGCGLTEVITYTMTNMESVSKLCPSGTRQDSSGFIKLINPISPDKAYMRQSLLSGMLETMSFNARLADQLMFFEIGRVYFPAPGQELPTEGRRLGITMTGAVERAWWMAAGQALMGFFHIKGVVEVLLERLGLTHCGYDAQATDPFHPGKCAVIHIDGVDGGFMGELHPEVQRCFDLPDQPVVAAELNLDVLFEKRSACRYQAISPFPPAKEDLAVVLDEEVPADRIVQVTLEAGRPLIKEALVFDVWRGGKIPDGKKSIAFSLTYQSEDHVLKADEMKQTREKIVRQLCDTLGASLRE
jgi:phenylalanyl-tRNA synthetase beta chain